MILDGAVSASRIPASHTALLDSYGNGLREAAIDVQRRHGLPLSELLGVIVVTDEDMVGVGATAELVDELLATLDSDSRENLDAFLSMPLPATHVRLVVWNHDGVSMARLDTVLPTRGGVA